MSHTASPSAFKMRFHKVAAVGFLAIAIALACTLNACSPSSTDSYGVSSSHANIDTATSAQGGKATVLIYMNGSDLESYDGQATLDIGEMVESNIGENANVVIQTMGTSEWQGFNIASDRSQRYAVESGKLALVDDDLGQLDSTKAQTLSDFVAWGTANYPAERYILLFWDHGSGPVYGFGHDEFQSDYAALTIDEIQEALSNNTDVHFDLIGMDCCIMSSLETCCMLAPFCDYAVLSEDFESGLGWSYSGWMAQLENNPAVDTVTLGSLIVDDMVAENETNPIGGSSTLALIDETAVPLLYSTWVDFAYENEDALLKKNYSQETEEHGRVAYKTSTAKALAAESAMSTRSESIPSKRGFFDELLFGGPSYTIDGSYDWTSENAVTISDYFITDIMAVAGSIDSDTSRALASALDTAIAHYGCTEDESVAMTGIAVTLPYGDAEFYDEMSLVFSNCGFDEEYIAWLENFVDASGSDTYYNYDEFIDEWIGWDYYYDSYDWNNWYYEDSEGWDDQYDSGYGWYDDYTYDYGWYDYGPAGGYDSHWDWWF